MSILSVPRLKELLDRLTSARAGYLDNLSAYTTAKAAYLDAAITSRASSTEVAKASIWSSSLAANLNRPVHPKTTTLYWSGSFLNPHIKETVSVLPGAGLSSHEGYSQFVTAQGANDIVMEKTARGRLSHLIVGATAGTASSTITGDIRWDNGQAEAGFTDTDFETTLSAGQTAYWNVIGFYDYNTTTGQINALCYEPIDFISDCRLRLQTNSSDWAAVTFFAYWKGQEFAYD